jgi:spermidine/putrescine transport system ATP-binding protein
LIASVDVERASKVFGTGKAAVRALDDVSVVIAENEFFTLLGPSGCGKTTLLRLIGGFEQPTSGEIHLAGEAMGRRPPHQRPVNTVFQSYALFPHLSVAQNIGFGLDMLRVAATEKAARIDEMLALVKLDGMADRKPGQLSGGQQQRVALARALAPQPRVLLLDEPLSALDLKLRKEMQLELKRLQTDTGITFVFVTHDQEEALTMSDRIAVMADGRILQIGSPSEIYEQPSVRFVADFIGESNFLEGEVTADGRGLSLTGGLLVPLSSVERPGRRITAAVRPERAAVVERGDRGFPALVDTVVYFGTDTILHLRLDNGLPFTVRVQNHGGLARRFTFGAAVGLVIPPDAVRPLED